MTKGLICHDKHLTLTLEVVEPQKDVKQVNYYDQISLLESPLSCTDSR